MEAMVSLDGILNFLKSLSLSKSNKEWLAAKLIEDIKTDKKAAKASSYTAFINDMCGAWQDERSAEEISAEIRNSHCFGITRNIMPL